MAAGPSRHQMTHEAKPVLRRGHTRGYQYWSFPSATAEEQA
jgi:hypothetical protein